MASKKSFSGSRLVLSALVTAAFAGGASLYPVQVPAAPLAKVAPQAAAVHQIVLSTGIVDGKMVFLDERNEPNPTLRAKIGDTIELRIGSGEGAQHDIAIPALNVASEKFDASTGATTVRFELTQAGRFEYFCTISGHRQIGMEGVFEVTDASGEVPARPVASSEASPAVVPVALGAIIPAVAAPPAVASAVNVALDARAVPAATARTAPQLVKYRIETVELVGRLADGTTFTYWTFDKKVPGPMLRVRAGDTVELTLANAASSKMIHSIDLHAVTGPGGGADDTQVAPGKEKTFTFKALKPGLYVYHCATALVPEHISAGMYGMILVEPEEGLPAVDREFYVMQGDIYTQGIHGAKGHQAFSTDKLAAELPDYYVFNGAVGSLTKEHALHAKVGETVRIYFGVGGPNKVSSFHVIGEIFDRVYDEGSTARVNENVQTTLVAPGGATIVEFKLDYPGKYTLVDHALSRVGKGLAATLEVSGEADASIYRVGSAVADL